MIFNIREKGRDGGGKGQFYSLFEVRTFRNIFIWKKDSKTVFILLKNAFFFFVRLGLITIQKHQKPFIQRRKHVCVCIWFFARHMISALVLWPGLGCHNNHCYDITTKCILCFPECVHNECLFQNNLILNCKGLTPTLIKHTYIS